jgi:D-arginine dehydrogenase
MKDGNFEVLVIGAGIAGASVAAHLARDHRVALLERESHPGYHSTGRSAALFSETYGNDVVRALSRASRGFFSAPTTGFAEHPLVRRRGALHIARSDQRASFENYLGLPDVAAHARGVDASETLQLCPLLRSDYAAAGIYEPTASDVDVHALHQGYLRMARAAGAVLIVDAAVRQLDRVRGMWKLQTRAGAFEAPIVVNASGAWADEVAGLAGATPLRIVPHRRTAVLVDPPVGRAIGDLPNTIDIDELFYFKPDAGQLFLSPADETPSPPCDAQPDELDVAIAIDRIQAVTTLEAIRVRRKWAGLRSFAPDRSPVIGYDREREGFFWLAGQGGYGIQTAPAAGLLAASLVRGGECPPELEEFDVSADAVSPLRFRVHESPRKEIATG